ncbi:hypothetical protein K4A83_03625 [Spirulina subsalsa FACHB-351]|uniref:DUF3592 domain-containing protein n=1 Tax=Spirulina subsalsa FACHB-351 TaxID=234711 RepID=A0ABT3L2Z9_9CYAN|nr:hypothetical protein [Spirulina subsalsa]MCW6035365.1 hypothetical protein [Spirulina subsalsa FACHB-351]
MSRQPINPFLLIGLSGFFTLGSQLFIDLYRVFYQDSTIYWTHQSMPLSLEQTENNFQLLIAGKSLNRHLSEQTLYGVDNQGRQYPIVAQDISVRLNNWPQVKANLLLKTTLTGFAFGITMTLLILGCVQTFNHPQKN